MKLLSVFLTTLLFSTMAFAGFRAWNQDTSIGLYNALKCDSSIKCARDGSKMQISLVGASAVSVTATSGSTLTSAQCGSYFLNSGATTVNLPDAGTVLGCVYRFVTAQAVSFIVNPDNADTILVLTNAAGDSITNATLGNTVSLLAWSASAWSVIGEKGTWSDTN